MKPTLLFIHTDSQTVRYDLPTLRQEYVLVHAHDRATAIAQIAKQRPAVLLPLLHSGAAEELALCQQLAQYQIPILALVDAALPTTVIQRLAPFIADFLPHPAGSADLLTRLALVRTRQTAHAPPVAERVTCGDLLIDLGARQVWKQGNEVKLTPTEWSFFEILVRAAGTLLPHELLRRQVWGEHHLLGVDSQRVHLHALRQKLGDDPANPRYIFVEKRVGIRFAPVTPVPGAPPTPVDLPRHVLPAQPNQCIGRDARIAHVAAMLREPGIRLLTLFGPAGVGKTRLALAVAETLAVDFPDGVAFVPLAPLDDSTLIVATILQVLRLTPVEGQSLEETLTQYLAPRRLLLVIDNCEHLPGLVAVVDWLLATARDLKLITTSRTVLALYGEHSVTVPPLEIPPDEPNQPWQTIAQVEAVQLFVQRARAVRSGFRLSADNAPTIAAICRHLEGLPLSIELAAAKLATMTPKTLLARLVRRLEVLRQELQHRTPRQTTLYDAIDWSFRLLTPAQQQLFTQLAIFSGGWTVAAATAVCGDDGSDEGTMAEELALLQHQSLIQRSETDDEEVYFTMLATIREFARDHLHGDGQFPLLQQRHATYFHELARTASTTLTGPDAEVWLDRLERDHDNLRTALRWAMTHAPELAAQLSSGIWRFWWVRGHYWEAWRWLTQVAHHPAPISPALRGQAFNAAGIMAQWQGNYLEARMLLTQALSMRQELGAPNEIADTLTNLSFLAQDLNDYTTAQGYLEQNLRIYRGLGDALAVADTLTNLGGLLDDSGDPVGALERLNEARVVWEASQDTGGLAATLINMGKAARNNGKLAPARQRIEQGLELYRQLDDKAGIASGLVNLGIVATLQGATVDARMLLDEALAWLEPLGTRLNLLEALEAIAAALHAGEQDAPAAQILMAVVALREREGRQRNVPDASRYAALQHALTQRLGETWPQLVQDGQRLTLEQAIGVARLALRSSSE